MTPKFYQILQRCIEDGLERGWNRAHKHNDTPFSAEIREAQQEAIMLEIEEWFDFGFDKEST